MKRIWIVMGCALAGFSPTAFAQDKESVPPAFERAEKDTAKTNQLLEENDEFDPDRMRPKLIRVQVEYVDVSHETLTKLLFFSNQRYSDAKELRKQVQDLVSKNEAKVLETQIVECHSGQKATTESIHEFLYPTEYDPHKMPSSGNSSSAPGCESKGEEGASNSSGISAICSSPAMPTAFETRNVGSTLEVEPTIGEDNRMIDLRFVPEFMWHSGNTVWHEGKDKAGNSFKIAMPDFYTVRLNTNFTCIDGQYNFVAALSPKNDKGETDTNRKLMVFVKCDIVIVK